MDKGKDNVTHGLIEIYECMCYWKEDSGEQARWRRRGSKGG